MAPPKPSQAMLRSLSDSNVLQAVMAARRLTRSQLATRTGLSKPTVSESVRRLADAGVLRDTGERTTGRGRIGSYYALADDVGNALAVSIAPGHVVAEALDAYGQVLRRATETLDRPASPEQARRALVQAASRACAGGGAVRVAAVSAADPVDRTSGRLVQLPDAPFLLGELSPVEALQELVAGPVTVDNDVNWAARAERDARTSPTADDFVYLYLGEGLGVAVVSDGQVRRGHSGTAGEIAHLLTAGPDGRATPFTDVFRTLDLRLPGSTAIDVDRLLATVSSRESRGQDVLAAVGRAVAGVVAAAVALLDPALVVVAGPWGRAPVVLQAVEAHVRELSRPAAVEPPRHTDDPALTGARRQALTDLRTTITKNGSRPQTTPQPA